jgi:hypothetical protein
MSSLLHWSYWLNTSQAARESTGGRAMMTRMTEEYQKILKFINHHKQMKAPYIIYADFEALTTKIDGAAHDPRRPTITKPVDLVMLLSDAMG